METTKKHFTATLLTEDARIKLLSTVKDFDESWGLAYATVEKPDSEGDVIKVNGIDLTTYHNPSADKHLTMLAGHAMSLDNGKPPIVGRVEQFYQTDYAVGDSTVPALAFSFSWAPGEVAQSWKELYPKYLKSFSVGVMYNAKDIMKNPSGGQDINKSMIYEVSPVPVPAHPDANAIKMIKQQLQIHDNAELYEAIKALSNEVESFKEGFNKINKVLDSVVNNTQEQVDRYDMLESLLVTSSSATNPSAKNDQKKELTQEHNEETVKKMLDDLIKFVSK